KALTTSGAASRARWRGYLPKDKKRLGRWLLSHDALRDNVGGRKRISLCRPFRQHGPCSNGGGRGQGATTSGGHRQSHGKHYCTSAIPTPKTLTPLTPVSPAARYTTSAPGASQNASAGTAAPGTRYRSASPGAAPSAAPRSAPRRRGETSPPPRPGRRAPSPCWAGSAR